MWVATQTSREVDRSTGEGRVDGRPLCGVALIVEPLVGAVIGESLVHRDVSACRTSGVAAWVGFVIGAAVKIALAFAMVAVSWLRSSCSDISSVPCLFGRFLTESRREEANHVSSVHAPDSRGLRRVTGVSAADESVQRHMAAQHGEIEVRPRSTPTRLPWPSRVMGPP